MLWQQRCTLPKSSATLLCFHRSTAIPQIQLSGRSSRWRPSGWPCGCAASFAAVKLLLTQRETIRKASAWPWAVLGDQCAAKPANRLLASLVHRDIWLSHGAHRGLYLLWSEVSAAHRTYEPPMPVRNSTIRSGKCIRQNPIPMNPQMVLFHHAQMSKARL